VRVKLDENIPESAAQPLRIAGHDVDTVADEHLAGASDLEVLRAASSERRLVVTLDRGFGDIRAHPPGSHAGVVVLRVDDQSPSAIAGEIDGLVNTVDLDELGGCVAVFHRGDLRVRRPEG